MPIIGIDLGTTNSLACVCRGGRPELVPNALGRFLTPSAVSVREDGSVCVGEEARERLFSQLTGRFRQQAAAELDRLSEAMKKGNDQETGSAARRAERVFRELEREVW